MANWKAMVVGLLVSVIASAAETGRFIGSPGIGVLVFVKPRSRGMDVARELRGALRPVDEGGKVGVAVRDVAARHQGLGAIGEGVFDGIAVEVLAAVGAAGKTPADAVRGYRQGILDPEALVNLVDHQLDEDAAGRPHELVGMAGGELPEQLVLAARERAH